MKVIELTAPRLDAFRPAAYPDPVPAYGEVLVRLRGASLNFLDLAVATGKYPLSSQISRISCLTLDARRCPGIRLAHRLQESRV